MRNRGIGRARMFVGAILLLASVLSWSIGLMMSPHGETVAHGTEYLRSTIVTFKRNGAIGTLILCAVATWLLFPKRRPKWPARDWALIALLGFLVSTSLYTLIWLRPSVPETMNVDENSATTDMNLDGNASNASSQIDAAYLNLPPVPGAGQMEVRDAAAMARSKGNDRARPDGRQKSPAANASEGQAVQDGSLDAVSGDVQAANRETDQNQE